MKNLLHPFLFLTLLLGLPLNSDSQVQIILNGLEFEPVRSSDYTVPDGKVLIITHMRGSCYLLGNAIGEGDSDYSVIATNIPVPAGATVTCYDQAWGARFAGYLLNMNDGVIEVGMEVSETNFNDENTGFKIYPNPATNEVSVFAEIRGSWNVTIYDMTGSVVLEAKSSASVKLIDTSSLSSGTYIVSAKTNRKHVGSSRLIIE